MAIKNFWSLNVDEALVADRLQTEFRKQGHEVFFPLRTQLKDVDLLLYDLHRAQARTIQVKGSRMYAQQPRQVERFGEGGAGWIIVSRKVIVEPTNPVDFFIFLIHLEVRGRIKREIVPHFVVVPRDELRDLVERHNKKIRKGGGYHFFMWVNPARKTATDYEEWHNNIDFTPHLNNFECLRAGC